MTDELKASVEELYRVFAPYRGVPMDVRWPVDVSDEEHARLVEPDLEKVGYEGLMYYLYEAVYVREVWDHVDVFRRFFPRLCEVLAFELEDMPWGIEIWLVLSHLGNAKWDEWPAHEHEAADHYLHTLWSHTLRARLNEDHWGKADDVFIGLPFAYPDLKDFLDEWREQIRRSLSAAVGFAGFLERNSSFFRTHMRKEFGLNWPARAEEQVLAWLREPELLDSLRWWLEHYALEDSVHWSLREAVELLGIYRDKHS
ncbi:MAG: hypothetical protein ACQEVA_01125 [Myxococcota bacterium]